jgi:uncharacterized protein
MEDLFRIESPLATVRWQALSARPSTIGASQVLPISVTPTLCKVHYAAAGPPRLFEQSDYRLVVRARHTGSRVEVRHRDPNLLRGVLPAEESSLDLLVGSINFRNQVGRSRFEVLVDGQHALSFEVEVFPSKLDYREDYEQILAEVQDMLTALAFEFLRSTHTSAQHREGPPTALEWALQLRTVIDDLERGLRHVARHPIRGLQREVRTVRAERIRRPDSSVMRAARTGAGQGGWIKLSCGSQVRAHLPTRQAEPTLDTQEHRWFAEHVSRARRHLALLIVGEAARKRRGARHDAALSELRGIEARLDGLLRLEPLEAATQAPHVGFTSLQLLGAPGYREAARALITLQLGLRLEGNALDLSLKDISTLYEYWCYLAVLDIVAQHTASPIDTRELVQVSAAGLHVMLEKGRLSTSRFPLSNDRSIRIEYNPKYSNHVLLSQQPDIVLAVEEKGRPTVRVVLDAKYRVDASAENREKLGVVGPPADALNVLHRYRDAILTDEPTPDKGRRVARSVVYAASLYPAVVGDEFTDSKLALQLRTIGVGAIPFLPSRRDLLTQWLESLLKLDRWSLGHGTQSAAADPWVWHAASEVVLVGVLRSAQKVPAHEHLDWCLQKNAYYIPERDTRHGRQMATTYIALYVPAALMDDGVGAVAWIGKVSESSVVDRVDLKTPWSAQISQEFVRLYLVEEWKQLERPIRNTDHHRVSAPRWSTQLAVQRASRLAELTLESPLEWSLFDALTAEGIEFDIRAGDIQSLTKGRTFGRAKFIVGPITITYASANGFALANASISTITQPTVQRVVKFLRRMNKEGEAASASLHPIL